MDACSTCGGSEVGMRLASSGEASSCLKAGGKGRERGLFSSSGSIVVELFLEVVEVIPSEDSDSWLAGGMVDDDVDAGVSEARVFLVGAGEKASPPPSTATRVPETGGAEVFGSLGALTGRSGDLGSVFLFLLTIVRQRGGAKTTEKLSAKGDDSGKRKRRDGAQRPESVSFIPIRLIPLIAFHKFLSTMLTEVVHHTVLHG